MTELGGTVPAGPSPPARPGGDRGAVDNADDHFLQRIPLVEGIHYGDIRPDPRSACVVHVMFLLDGETARRSILSPRPAPENSTSLLSAELYSDDADQKELTDAALAGWPTLKDQGSKDPSRDPRLAAFWISWMTGSGCP